LMGLGSYTKRWGNCETCRAFHIILFSTRRSGGATLSQQKKVFSTDIVVFL